MVTIKHTRESIAELEQERNDYKQQRDSLIKDVEEMRRKVDELESLALGRSKYIDAKNYEISQLEKVVEKLREELKDMEDDYSMVNGKCMYREDKLHWLNEQYDKLLNKYTNLTEHIKDKAINNLSVSRYIDLVHVIDELERDTDEG